jgi:hypothetical protein
VQGITFAPLAERLARPSLRPAAAPPAPEASA